MGSQAAEGDAEHCPCCCLSGGSDNLVQEQHGYPMLCVPCAVTNRGHGVHYLKCINERQNKRKKNPPLECCNEKLLPSQVKISRSVQVCAASLSPSELPSMCACTEHVAQQVRLELTSPFPSQTNSLSATASCWVLPT